MYYMIILVIYKLLGLFGGVLGVFVKIKDQTKKTDRRPVHLPNARAKNFALPPPLCNGPSPLSFFKH